MKHIHQQNLCQSIISHNRYQIIHRRDKRTRRNCRVNLQLVKQQLRLVRNGNLQPGRRTGTDAVSQAEG